MEMWTTLRRTRTLIQARRPCLTSHPNLRQKTELVRRQGPKRRRNECGSRSGGAPQASVRRRRYIVLVYRKGVDPARRSVQFVTSDCLRALAGLVRYLASVAVLNIRNIDERL